MAFDPPHGPSRGAAKTAALYTVAIGVLIVASLIYVPLCVVLLPSRSLRIRLGNVYGKLVGPLIFGLAGIRPVIHNPARITANFPAIYVCNHTSTADMWLGMWLCPYGGCGGAKQEIRYLPFFGQAYWLSGHLLLDRGNRENALASMAKVRRVMHKHNLGVWMWPEGTRSQDGRLRPFKKGFVHLAIAAGLPVVPVVFHNADVHWPSKQFRTVPGALHIEVLEPIDTKDWKPGNAGEHVRVTWQAFQDALSDRQKALLSRPKVV